MRETRGGGEKFIGLEELKKMQIHAVFSPRHLNRPSRVRMMMMWPTPLPWGDSYVCSFPRYNYFFTMAAAYKSILSDAFFMYTSETPGMGELHKHQT
jgi:hypothetical protein